MTAVAKQISLQQVAIISVIVQAVVVLIQSILYALVQAILQVADYDVMIVFVSSLVGGIAYLAPYTLFVFSATWRKNVQSAGEVLFDVVLGTVGKFILTFVIFAIAFVSVQLAYLVVFSSFGMLFITQIVTFLALNSRYI